MIESSDWAKRFKQDSPVSYPQALVYAAQPNLKVVIVNSTPPDTHDDRRRRETLAALARRFGVARLLGTFTNHGRPK